MYIYLLAPIVAFTIAQGLKIILRASVRKITWHDIFAYSDMPSGHTSVVVAITTIMALEFGINSPFFAIAFVFATIVIVDAIGLRNYLGLHGKTINILVKDLDEDDFLDHNYPKQLEKIGHTPAQVIVGGIIGILTSLGFFLFY
ncbi:MAG: divergent PAP2 family protein [Patescibacteria group bacterium]|nr:divergent PAP2 family protein [Patescibacteria group bacterium]MDD3777842.1 divergent PAP2 family protein [Patescibacteria group bacterium]MDD3939342.1 divergent PAP2 family protein [Patescibacteria group bacterium]MDD4443981.1 divergent PAP2 family protein [Patescibacteria group bacterium]NCU39454.1 divergent PAP2 family protein [Candidatus Falkowbacteria bacterium]